MKTKLITIISVLVVIAGLAILAYPIISNMMFQKSQQELIDFYDSQINEIPEKTKDSMLEECRKYNSGLLDSKVQLVITDIEMPQMDGHRLTHMIKTDDKLKDIPVVIFSSLVNEEMRIKGEALGADAQLSKPEIGNLVRIVDKLVSDGKVANVE